MAFWSEVDSLSWEMALTWLPVSNKASMSLLKIFIFMIGLEPQESLDGDNVVLLTSLVFLIFCGRLCCCRGFDRVVFVLWVALVGSSGQLGELKGENRLCPNTIFGGVDNWRWILWDLGFGFFCTCESLRNVSAVLADKTLKRKVLSFTSFLRCWWFCSDVVGIRIVCDPAGCICGKQYWFLGSFHRGGLVFHIFDM